MGSENTNTSITTFQEAMEHDGTSHDTSRLLVPIKKSPAIVWLDLNVRDKQNQRYYH